MTADIPVIKMTPSHSTHPKAQFILSPAQSRTTTIDERSVAPQEKSIMAEQDTQGSLEGQVLKMPPEGSDAPTEATRTTEPGLAFDHPQQRTDTVTQDTETTKTEYTSDSCKVNSQFENLPAELRRHILSMMELDSLNALVRASRVYFEQFREDHQNLLCQCLESTLGSVAADAYAVHQTSSKEFLNQRTPSKIREFLKSYHYLRSQSWFTPFHKVLDMEGALSTIKFHCSTVQPLARHFFSLALNYLDKETKRSLDHKPLSRTEEIRLMRALYRFQLCCNLYGLGFDDTLPDAESLELGKMVLDEFIAIFEPWESEEIFCFVLFAREKYEAIFDEIAWDVNEANPKYDDHRPGTPPGTFQLNGNGFLYLNGLITSGLGLLHSVHFRIKQHEHLVTTMQNLMRYSEYDILHDDSSAFSVDTQRERHCSNPTDRDDKQGLRAPLTFEGDRQSNGSRSSPPLAWTLVWGNTYSNIFGQYIPKSFQRWGWVMWDAARLEHTGAKELIMKQWEKWKEADSYDDPRQPFWSER